MTMRYVIRCDGCGNEQLYGVPHLALCLRPAFAGSGRDSHFCDTKCMSDHLAVLTRRLNVHADAFHARRLVPPGSANR